ncbi:type II toxin-antitoxin system Phd/YefM family antitoxin [Candidatus Fermentibacteria bacterium]|nr:type II toxin-antitoxin system Phd/YefM family antitoxin [Candidatus Fermentibacteria bacterium]
MRTVNIHEAKTHLSRLVEEANAGDEIVIAKAGKPAVVLVPARKNRRPRTLGWLAGKLEVPDDFDAPLPDGILAAFEGDDRAPAG